MVKTMLATETLLLGFILRWVKPKTIGIHGLPVERSAFQTEWSFRRHRDGGLLWPLRMIMLGKSSGWWRFLLHGNPRYSNHLLLPILFQWWWAFGGGGVAQPFLMDQRSRAESAEPKTDLLRGSDTEQSKRWLTSWRCHRRCTKSPLCGWCWGEKIEVRGCGYDSKGGKAYRVLGVGGTVSNDMRRGERRSGHRGSSFGEGVSVLIFRDSSMNKNQLKGVGGTVGEWEGVWPKHFRGIVAGDMRGLKVGRGPILNWKKKGLTGSCRSSCDFYTKQDRVPGRKTGRNRTGGEEKRVEGLAEFQRASSRQPSRPHQSWPKS